MFSPHSDINMLIGSNGCSRSNLMDIIYMMLKQYILCNNIQLTALADKMQVVKNKKSISDFDFYGIHI